MSPTVDDVTRSYNVDTNQRLGEKRSDLVCRVKYNNTLPDIPFDPKFITYPFESNRFYQYKPTSLEQSFTYDLSAEHDLDVTIDLINPDTYRIDPNVYLDLEDEKLLEDEQSTLSDSKRSRHHNTNVSWLRKTEYISTEYNRFIQKSDKSESKVGFKIKQLMREEDLYKDRDSQIAAIEHVFECAQSPITKHYSKPGVEPKEILPVLPDFKSWKLPFAQVLFDSDPADNQGKNSHVLEEEMSQAMIRGAVDESGQQFVAYFLPTEETMRKRKVDFEEGVNYNPDQKYEYYLAREYNWNVKNKLSKGYEETYFFVLREDGMFYNELETRVRLSKRRKVGSQHIPKSWLDVKHRELNDMEHHDQEMRLTMLKPSVEEEDEEMAEGGDESADSNDAMHGAEPDSADENYSDNGSVKSQTVSRHSRSRSRSISSSCSRAGSRSASDGGRSVSKSRSRSRSEVGSEKGSESENNDEKEEERAIFGSDSNSSDNRDRFGEFFPFTGLKTVVKVEHAY